MLPKGCDFQILSCLRFEGQGQKETWDRCSYVNLSQWRSWISFDWQSMGGSSLGEHLRQHTDNDTVGMLPRPPCQTHHLSLCLSLHCSPDGALFVHVPHSPLQNFRCTAIEKKCLLRVNISGFLTWVVQIRIHCVWDLHHSSSFFATNTQCNSEAECLLFPSERPAGRLRTAEVQSTKCRQMARAFLLTLPTSLGWPCHTPS